MRINKEILPEGIFLKAISPLGFEKAQRIMGYLLNVAACAKISRDADAFLLEKYNEFENKYII